MDPQASAPISTVSRVWHRRYARLLVERERVRRLPGETVEAKVREKVLGQNGHWRYTPVFMLLFDVGRAEAMPRSPGYRPIPRWKRIWEFLKRHDRNRRTQPKTVLRQEYLAVLADVIEEYCDYIAKDSLKGGPSLPWGEAGNPRVPDTAEVFARICRVLRERDPDTSDPASVASILEDAVLPAAPAPAAKAAKAGEAAPAPAPAGASGKARVPAPPAPAPRAGLVTLSGYLKMRGVPLGKIPAVKKALRKSGTLPAPDVKAQKRGEADCWRTEALDDSKSVQEKVMECAPSKARRTAV